MQLKHVLGEGPRDAAVMLIGERPGALENRLGRPFVGPSGQELDRYLLVNAGLDRSAIYITHVVDTYSEDAPTAEEIAANRQRLADEVEFVRPQYIGLVGLHAARTVLGPTIEMSWAHGLCWPRAELQRKLIGARAYMPLYPPAEGMHMPAIAAKVAYDFTEFGRMVRGDAMPDGHLHNYNPAPHYWEATHGHSAITMAVDTEGSVDAPWCASASVMSGYAAVLRPCAGRVDLSTPLMVLHNALHDLPVLAAMGVTIQGWTDTMLMANLLGIEPKGLKALARRHCGMQLREYDDVVQDARRTKAIEFLAGVLEGE